MEKRYTVKKTRPGADCGSDHELLIAKFRLKLKKVGKTRPFGYDLNQIPYDYTVEVRNRFKGLDLIDKLPDELWMEVRDTVQETGIKTIPMEKTEDIDIIGQFGVGFYAAFMVADSVYTVVHPMVAASLRALLVAPSRSLH